MFDIWKFKLDRINHDWLQQFGKPSANKNIVLTRAERRKIQRKS